VIEDDGPAHHPAVVLRSQYAFVRSLLGVATAAVAALTVAVVVLASSDHDSRTAYGFAEPIQSIDYGGFNPSTGRPETAPQPRLPGQE
jgi:hypothetical protein